MKQQNPILLIAVCAALITGCSDSTTDSSSTGPAPADTTSTAADTPAVLPDEIIVSEPIDGAVNVMAAREDVQPGAGIILTGYIGGRAQPLADGRAVFTLADKELTRCDANPDDGCATPWDACCVSSDLITKSIASVQLVDADGAVLKQSLNGWQGIRPGSYVTVAGTIAEGASSGALIINANKIHVETAQ